MAVWITLFVVIVLVFLLNYYFPYFFKAFRLTIFRGHWTATTKDLSDFPSRAISIGKPKYWSKGESYNELKISDSFKRQVADMKTSALVAAQNGHLVYEGYFGLHEKDTLSNSFSMAKTIVALMTGKAIEDGYIQSLDQKVSDFFHQYDYPLADQLTLRDLIRMSSGMDWRENYYHPFNETTEAYYGSRLTQLILERKIINSPGQTFNYQSSNTQLLGMILDKVLPVSLSTYLSETFWKPLGMEHTAYWTLDKTSGVEKTYCCIHAVARDYLKFGQLLLQNGEWCGSQLIPAAFIEEMRIAGFPASPQYGAGLWLDDTYKYPFYLMRGHLGQYVIVIPSENLVICRLGEKYMKDDNPPRLQLEDIYMYIDGVIDMVNGEGEG